MTRKHESYQVRPFPKVRRAYVDVLREGHRRHIIHGLVEMDATDAGQRMAEMAKGGQKLSFTGYIVACVAQAVDENPMMHAHRWGRNKLVLFEEVDVNLQLEQVDPDGTRIVQSRIVRGANRKTVSDITAEIREAKKVTLADRRRLRGTQWLVRIPAFIRRLIWRAVMKRPWWTKRFGGTIAVSSVGMFGTNLGWGIPITPAPLMVTVGGIGQRPVIVDKEVVEREYVSVTISVDHDIIDGAPAARFTQRLRELVEGAYGLESGGTR